MTVFRVSRKPNGDYCAEKLNPDNTVDFRGGFSSEHWAIFERELRYRLVTGQPDPVRQLYPVCEACGDCHDATNFCPALRDAWNGSD